MSYINPEQIPPGAKCKFCDEPATIKNINCFGSVRFYVCEVHKDCELTMGWADPTPPNTKCAFCDNLATNTKTANFWNDRLYTCDEHADKNYTMTFSSDTTRQYDTLVDAICCNKGNLSVNQPWYIKFNTVHECDPSDKMSIVPCPHAVSIEKGYCTRPDAPPKERLRWIVPRTIIAPVDLDEWGEGPTEVCLDCILETAAIHPAKEFTKYEKDKTD